MVFTFWFFDLPCIFKNLKLNSRPLKVLEIHFFMHHRTQHVWNHGKPLDLHSISKVGVFFNNPTVHTAPISIALTINDSKRIHLYKSQCILCSVFMAPIQPCFPDRRFPYPVVCREIYTYLPLTSRICNAGFNAKWNSRRSTMLWHFQWGKCFKLIALGGPGAEISPFPSFQFWLTHSSSHYFCRRNCQLSKT